MLAWLCPGQAGYWRAHLQASVRAWVHTCLHMPRTPRWKPSPDVVRSWQFYDDDQMIFQAALSGRLNCRRLLCYSLLRVVSFCPCWFPFPVATTKHARASAHKYRRGGAEGTGSRSVASAMGAAACWL